MNALVIVVVLLSYSIIEHTFKITEFRVGEVAVGPEVCLAFAEAEDDVAKVDSLYRLTSYRTFLVSDAADQELGPRRKKNCISCLFIRKRVGAQIIVHKRSIYGYYVKLNILIIIRVFILQNILTICILFRYPRRYNILETYDFSCTKVVYDLLV